MYLSSSPNDPSCEHSAQWELRMNQRRTQKSRHPRRLRERAASLVEYALLMALIALVCFAAVTYLGQEAGSAIGDAGTELTP